MKNVLAIDFGASSGRAVIGSFDGTVIKLTEIHRFSNDPVILGKTMYWDFLRLFHEIKQSLIKSKEYGEIDSIAIDTWGVDFGLIDKSGRLLENLCITVTAEQQALRTTASVLLTITGCTKRQAFR